MKPPRSRREWTSSEFRRDFPSVPSESRKPLREIANRAVSNGLTRQAVREVVEQWLGESREGDVNAAALIGKLAERAFPVSEVDRKAWGYPSAESVARDTIDEYREGGL